MINILIIQYYINNQEQNVCSSYSAVVATEVAIRNRHRRDKTSLLDCPLDKQTGQVITSQTNHNKR